MGVPCMDTRDKRNMTTLAARFSNGNIFVEWSPDDYLCQILLNFDQRLQSRFYHINVLRQTACLVVNQITVDNFASPLIARWQVEPQTI